MVPISEQSEEELKIIFNNFNDGVLLANLETKKFSSGNPAICKMLGYSQEELGKLAIEDIHPKEDLPRVLKELERQARGEITVAKNLPVKRKDGSIFYADINSSPIELNGIKYMLGIFRDVSERREAEAELIRANRALRVVSNINQSLIHIDNEETFLSEACRVAVELGGYQLAWIGLAENDEEKTIRPAAHAESKPGYLDGLKLTWADTEFGRGPSGTAIRTRESIIARDIASDPIMTPWRDRALKYGYHSSIALPLINNENTLGMIAIYSGEKDAFSEGEVEILKEVASDIAFGIATNRVRAERKLMTAAVETSGEVIFMTDKEGIITFINPEFTGVYGYSANEVVGKVTPRILKSGQRKPEEYTELWNNLIAGKVVKDEHINKTKDGRFLTIESTANPIFDNKGTVIGFLAIQRDVTERKAIEERYRHIVDTTNEGIWVLGKEQELTFVNPRTTQMLGYTEKELLGKKMDAFLAPKELADHKRQMVERQKGNAGFYERLFLKKDGTPIWCNVSATPLYDDKKNFIGSFGMLTDITERKKAEEVIHAASQYTRSLIEASLDPLVTISPSGKITDVNKATETVTGRPRGELIQTDFSDYFVDSEKARDGYRQVFREGIVRDYPLEIRHKDGHITPVLYNASIYRDSKDNVVGVFAAARDITERKKAEIEREQYFKFFNLSTDIMVIADPNGAFKKVNQTCINELGYSEGELISKPFIDFVHPDDKQTTLDEMQKQIASGSSLDFENRYMCKDGRVLWLSWRANFNKEEGITYATARDITERKKAEEVIHKNEAELREAQRIGRFGNFDWDSRTDVIKWSDEYYHIYGIPLGTKPPGYEDHLKMYTRDSAARLDAAVKNSMATGEPYEVDLEQANPPEGAARWLTARGEVKRDENNKIVGLRGTAQDITERKKAEERIKELSELRSKFLNIMAHQLRTPLSSVNWNLEMLISGDMGKLEDTQKKFLQVTYNESKKITNRIRDLLAAVDIEDRRALVKKEVVAIDGLITSIVGEARERATLKGLRFSYNGPSKELPEIIGDNEKLRIALSQLVENAITYTPDNGEVVVTLTEKKGMIRFEVRDTGVGVPVAEQHRIDERFYRASNASLMHPDGFGLGLYVTKYFIEQHNGLFGFESVEGKGSTFWVELPAKK